MASSLDIYRRADEPSALATPSVDRCSLTKRDKINSEASQSYAGRNLIKLLGSNYIVILQCCINTGAFRLSEHQRKPSAIGTLAGSFDCQF
jgi:hypothetical protein